MGFVQATASRRPFNWARSGGSFPPNYGESVFAKTGRPMRNATVTTIAPTGTISIIAGCSSGVEPIFALAFTRNVMDDDRLIEVNGRFEEILREKGLYTEGLIEKVARQGNVQGLTEIPDDLKRVLPPPMRSRPSGIFACRPPFRNLPIMPYPKRLTSRRRLPKMISAKFIC